ncbi:MAG TPA: hypothetical protein VKV95_23545 [Terriglobia bacterium]|nr:hypothetical protein [Terriglobia bacterium]
MLRGRPVEAAAQDEKDTLPDRRATQYVDVDGSLSKSYARVINLPSSLPAWDVYFVFGPDASWPEGQGSKPPAPTYWMHQLGRAGPPDQILDAGRLNTYVGGLLLKMGN